MNKTLNDFIEPERRIALTPKGKALLENKRSNQTKICSPSSHHLDSDVAYEPNMKACENVCLPEDIDLCRERGRYRCRRNFE